ncbi:DNA polymerase [Heliophilum fasciatum]|uniref:DNA polymerase I n=1 Tax=Heliophilum fasciatum TaxID=35700 RepID=A0A4R2RRQ3_9FIRM|nr:DNA polymerase [Heliophilum fasciatum]MCW2278699.1 DNA polymerase-1 [Heliophilum fasciatum]TCP62561.1 DNA polymerase-1 [Heliophilum fasciatum]
MINPKLQLEGLREPTLPNALDRVWEAQHKKEMAKREPTWDEVWVTGWTSYTGTFKKAIFQTGLTDLDKQRLKTVKAAIDAGEIGVGVESLRKFTKAHALRLWRELQDLRKHTVLKDMVAKTPANYRLIQTGEQLAQLVTDLAQETIVAFDTETTGLDVYNDVIVGMSLTLPKADFHVYIPVAHKVGQQLDRTTVLKRLEPCLSSPAIGKVLHNAKYDIHMLLRHNVRMRGLAHDTRVAMALLNENEPSYALKNLATKYGKFFGFHDTSHTFEDLFGKTRFDDVPLDVALVYAAKDTHLTWKLYQWQREHLNRLSKLDGLYRDLENPLIDVCVDMEQTGFLIDRQYAGVYGEELRQEITKLQQSLHDHFGELNFNSPIQLARKFYDELQLPEVNGRSTDMKTLKALRDKHPGIEVLLRYRELSKLLSTYVEALPEQMKSDGRIHGSFNQVATVTGRFSSNEPNLQNLPTKARKLIVAPPGKLLVGSDFSQIEPRVLAHISGDPHLQEPYLRGQDLYSTLASRVFKVPMEDCGDGSKYRKMMKVGLLAVMYGTSMHTLSSQLGITEEAAQQFIRDFFQTYPRVHSFIKSTHEFVKENEYVETLYGRKRRFPGHRQKAKVYDRTVAEICKLLGVDELPVDFWQNKAIPRELKNQFRDVKRDVESARRQSVNAVIQGTAADIMKRAMLNLHRYCTTKGWALCGTVHDEALMIVDASITAQEVAEMEHCMTCAAQLDIPLKVDTDLMTRWGEGITKKEWFVSAA